MDLTRDKPVSSNKRQLPPQDRTGEVPQAKRTRVSRACDQCRLSREKCSGESPACQTCISQKRTCSYNEQPRKRGIPPNYIRSLELLAAWFTSRSPSSAAYLSNQLAGSDNDELNALSGRDPTSSETLHQSWRDSLLCRQLDQMLSAAPIEKPPETSAENIEHLGNLSNDVSAKANPISLHHATEVAISEAAPSSMKLPKQAWSLLEHYLAFTHAWLPFVDQTELMKLMYSYPAEGFSEDELDSRHEQLWAIFILSDLQMNRNLKPAYLKIIQRRIYRIMIGNIGSFNTFHVSALLLMALVHLTNGQENAAWLTVGIAMRLLAASTSEEIASGEMSSPEESSNCLRVAAFVLESATSAQLGLLPYLPEDAALSAVVSESGIDEWKPWSDPCLAKPSAARLPTKARSTINTLARLSRDSNAINAVSGKRLLIFDVVRALVQNARDEPGQRLQPSYLLARLYQTASYSDAANALEVTVPEIPDWTPAAPAPFLLPEAATPASDHDAFPFSTEFSSNSNMMLPEKAASDTSLDMFEELAALEDNESTNHPRFLQNLGFGPDLDLAEFFGPDYMSSDPLLAYLQPQVTKSVSHSEIRTSTSADLG